MRLNQKKQNIRTPDAALAAGFSAAAQEKAARLALAEPIVKAVQELDASNTLSKKLKPRLSFSKEAAFIYMGRIGLTLRVYNNGKVYLGNSIFGDFLKDIDAGKPAEAVPATITVLAKRLAKYQRNKSAAPASK
jgi:hypothetical protein